MFDGELTIHDVLNDPMIRQVMKADGVTSDQLKSLLHKVRQRLMGQGYRDIWRSGTTASRQR